MDFRIFLFIFGHAIFSANSKFSKTINSLGHDAINNVTHLNTTLRILASTFECNFWLWEFLNSRMLCLQMILCMSLNCCSNCRKIDVHRRRLCGAKGAARLPKYLGPGAHAVYAPIAVGQWSKVLSISTKCCRLVNTLDVQLCRYVQRGMVDWAWGSVARSIGVSRYLFNDRSLRTTGDWVRVGLGTVGV